MLNNIFSLNGCMLWFGFCYLLIPLQDGDTVLHTACEYGQSDVMMWLVDKGVPLNSVNKVSVLFN